MAVDRAVESVMEDKSNRDQPSISPQTVTVLQTFLEILHAINTSTDWDSAALLAAFQWATALDKLCCRDSTATATVAVDHRSSVHQQLLDKSQDWAPLPYWLDIALPELITHPQQTLLKWLLQTKPGDGEWLQKVLGAYTAACVLPADSSEEQRRLEQEACVVLADKTAERWFIKLLQDDITVKVDRFSSQIAIRNSNVNTSNARALAVTYFTSAEAMQLAAAASLLVQRMTDASKPSTLEALLPRCLTVLEMSIVAMALLVPSWESMLGMLCSNEPPSPKELQQSKLPETLKNALIKTLSVALKAKPSLSVDVHPSLMGMTCRISNLHVVKAYAAALKEAVDKGQCGSEQLKKLLQHAWLHENDQVSAYLKSKF